jgi:hypothetical protein
MTVAAHASPGTVSTSWTYRVLVLALGTALVYGVLSRGAFHAGDAATVLVLVAAAAGARLGVRRPGVRRPAGRPVRAVVLALLGFAAWSVALAAARGDAGTALPAAAVSVGLAAAAWSATGLDPAGRGVLRAVVPACGVLVAATGWLGVVLHAAPWALLSSGLWRASSTLTYANAAAALLVATVLLVAATHPPGRRTRVVVFALLLGLVATLSRAGLLTLLVGAAVLLASGPHRARLRALAAVPVAVAVAGAGLLPALPEGAPPQPLPALAGLAAGLALVLAGRRAVAPAAVGAAAALVAVAVAVPASTWSGIAATRLSATSAERADLARVTAEQFLAAPLTGTGPGRLDLLYVDHRGALVQASFTHDEYLQTAAETGLVGLALVGAALGALALAGARRWRSAAGPPVLAVTAAFAVHSAFDFLWHVPVLPLLLVLGTVPLLSRNEEDP